MVTPTLWLVLPTSMNTLNPPLFPAYVPSSAIYITMSRHNTCFPSIHSPPRKLLHHTIRSNQVPNSLPTHQQTPFNYTSSKSLTNNKTYVTKSYNQSNEGQVTSKDTKKRRALYEIPIPRSIVCKGYLSNLAPCFWF